MIYVPKSVADRLFGYRADFVVLTLSAIRKISEMSAKKGKSKGKAPEKLEKAVVAEAVVKVTKAPNIKHLPRGEVVIEHQEYFADLAGSTGYAGRYFQINPGLSDVFPWLNRVANNYERYKWEKLSFEFRSMSATSEKGSVLLTVDQDASDTGPTTKGQSLAYFGSMEFAPWMTKQIHVTGFDRSKQFFVRSGTLSTISDVKLYDACSFFPGTTGQASGGTTLGSLWVSYRIRLFIPQINSLEGGLSKYIMLEGVGTQLASQFRNGNLLMLVVPNAGTNLVTYTFQEPWLGIATYYSEGTGLQTPTSTGTTTRDNMSTVLDAASGSATKATVTFSINAAFGQTFILTTLATTSVRSYIMFSQAQEFEVFP